MARTPRIPPELALRPFTLDEARVAGLTLSALRGRSWRRLGSGLYVFAGLREDALQRLHAWHQRLPDAVFTGLTAAWLSRLDVDPCHPIEVVLPAGSGVRSRPGLLVRNRVLPRSEITLYQNLPATTLQRTMRDLSKRLPRVEYLVLADEALRIGLGRFDSIAEPAESPMETRLRWLLIEAGLPMPEVQTDLYDNDGSFIARVDLYYPSAHLVIEFDGGNHRDRLVSDDRRQNALFGAGYRVLRFTSADLYGRPQAVVAQVAAALPGTRPTGKMAINAGYSRASPRPRTVTPRPAPGPEMRPAKAGQRSSSTAGIFAASKSLEVPMPKSSHEILESARTIAVVGASRDSRKAGGSVPAGLQARGFRVIPVNPYADTLFGEPVYRSLLDVPEKVDIVDVFRPAPDAPAIARQAAAIGAKALWLQLDIRSDEARQIAAAAGMDYVEDECTAVVASLYRIRRTAA